MSAPAPDSAWNQVLQRLRAATAGEFVIQRELGRGGFAAVFLAHEIALGRKVAIKVMSPAVMMGDGMVERFLQEARTVASLNHPHIITIHSVRRLEELPYFVMQFVRGRSLEHVLRREGPLPVPVIRDLLFQVGSALAYAHRRGVIHRDVKPANILLGDEGNAIVTDFGIAKVAESPHLTVTGMVIGTLTYMSPEQCDAGAIGWTSDQYSLGIVAYEMLTGTVPFTGSGFAVMHAHAETPPPPIRVRRPDCPPDLESAVNRMLAKDPGERWPTMGDALAALGAVAAPDTDPLREELARLARVDPGEDDDGPSTVPSPAVPLRAPAHAGVGAFSLALSPPPESLPVGRKVQLTAVLRDASSREVHRPIEWRSTDPSVATVSADGVVTALGHGETAISARAEGAEGSVRLIVAAPSEPESAASDGAGVRTRKRWWWAGAAVAAGAIAAVAAMALGRRDRASPVGPSREVAVVELSSTHSAVSVGDSAMLIATVKNDRGVPVLGQGVTWATSDPAVVSVDSTGMIVARSPGTAAVTATRDRVSAEATITVTAKTEVVAPATVAPVAVAPVAVAPVAVAPATVTAPSAAPRPTASVTVIPAQLTITVGDTQTIRAQALDSSRKVIEGRAVSWTSDDPSIATVAGSGTVMALQPGTTALRAKADGKTAALPVTVRARAGDVASVRIVPRDTTIPVGATLALTGTVTNAAGAVVRRSPTWESPNSAVAAVDETGRVTGRSPGRAQLIGRSGDRADTVVVTVITPAPVAAKPAGPTDARIQDLAAGGSLTCVTLTGGQTTCWGGGQRGPIAIAGFSFTQVTTGESHACGLTGAAEAYCWGANSQGQLGDGSTTDQATPVAVKLAQRFSMLSAGATHTCGIAVSGVAYCWGGNGSGQLGDGSTNARPEPALVRGNLELKQIAAGGAHTCALTNKGEVLCWGDGSSGQLGNRSQEMSAEPFLLEASASFKLITAGHRHTCALTDAGKAYCWGANAKGQLGDASTDDRPWPQPVVLIEPFRSIDAGTAHTCGVLAKGGLFCWGDNSNGQLGDGTRLMRLRPAAVIGGQRFATVEAGAVHTCGTAESGRRLLCWGSSSRGQTGGAAGGIQTVPTEVDASP